MFCSTQGQRQKSCKSETRLVATKLSVVLLKLIAKKPQVFNVWVMFASVKTRLVRTASLKRFVRTRNVSGCQGLRALTEH